MNNEQQDPRRITHYTSLTGFQEVLARSVPFETLTDQDILIMGVEEKEITTPEGKVAGAAILLTLVESGELIKSLTFSSVVFDQLRQVPSSEFPVLATVSVGGKGTRKFFHLT